MFKQVLNVICRKMVPHTAAAAMFIVVVMIPGLMVSVPANSQSTLQKGIAISFLGTVQETPTSSSIVQNDVQVPPDTSYTRPVVSYFSEEFYLVVLVLVLLGMLFILLLSWSRRREMAGYYGQVYRATVENWEYRRLIAPLTEKWDNGEYHSEIELDNHLPEPRSELKDLAEELGKSYLLELGGILPGRTRRPGSGVGGLGTPPPSIALPSGDEDSRGAVENEYEKFDAQFKKYKREVESWRKEVDREALKKYLDDQAKERKEAKKLSKKAAGEADLSVLRGRGAEFVLEFTAVVVIIFAAVILGILDILHEEHIGTLLAAIAGYVLGRATNEARKTKSDATDDDASPNAGDQVKEESGKPKGS